jgi:hypothetical protein
MEQTGLKVRYKYFWVAYFQQLKFQLIMNNDVMKPTNIDITIPNKTLLNWNKAIKVYHTHPYYKTWTEIRAGLCLLPTVTLFKEKMNSISFKTGPTLIYVPE